MTLARVIARVVSFFGLASVAGFAWHVLWAYWCIRRWEERQ